MPDWTYQTVFKPILFSLPVELSRRLALGVMGSLGRSPIGPLVIDFMGHMNPDLRLSHTINGVEYTNIVGLGAGIDIDATATSALARFGFGFIEVGPVTLAPTRATIPTELGSDESIVSAIPAENLGVRALVHQLKRHRNLRVRLFARLQVEQFNSPEDASLSVFDMAEILASHVQDLTIECRANDWSELSWFRFFKSCVNGIHKSNSEARLWIVLPADLRHEKAEELARLSQAAGFFGIHIDGTVADEARQNVRRMGKAAKLPTLALIRMLREKLGRDLVINASGGVHDPSDALDLKSAGANLITIDSGLVFTGPGLPKRVNSALLYEHEAKNKHTISLSAERPPELAWFWLTLMGLSMLIGSLIALIIAATRVILPYDEQFVGMTRDALHAINPRLLAFMTHDRVTLAGTMVTIGVMYCGLAWFGVRQGLHWARASVEISAFVGFISFFLFLGFGYFDPFHAFVTATLFQFLLMGIHARLGPPSPLPAPELHNTSRWRRALWGQLIFVMQSVAFIVAGTVISYVGVTSVFVQEDLHFMETTSQTIAASNPRVLSLIAHDRTTFGGMLISSGLVFLTSALWGFRRGACWLWIVTLVSGLAGYGAAIGVHFVVGYENLWHLAPAFGGLAMFLIAAALSFGFYCKLDDDLEKEWSERLKR